MPKPDTAHIFICVGEKSGDKLAEEIIISLKQQYPTINISGVGGDAMQSTGIRLISHYKTLAVMGYWDVLRTLPAILNLQKKIQQHLLTHKPDLFIGIDAPDFNLRLAKFCHHHAIKTVHYVSPQVWMWKSHRLKKIHAIINCVWLLFPFEKAIYKQHNIPFRYVGHIAARREKTSKTAARQAVNIPSANDVIAVLIGSRPSELKHHLPIIKDVIQKLDQPNRSFITTCPNKDIANIIRQTLPNIIITDLNTTLAAADIGIIKSGTITLEATVYALPMVVYFQTNWFNKQLLRLKTFRLPFFALPNILSNRFIVPELLLDEATPDLIVREANDILNNPTRHQAIRLQLQRINQSLQTADITPAQAACELLKC